MIKFKKFAKFQWKIQISLQSIIILNCFKHHERWKWWVVCLPNFWNIISLQTGITLENIAMLSFSNICILPFENLFWLHYRAICHNKQHFHNRTLLLSLFCWKNCLYLNLNNATWVVVLKNRKIVKTCQFTAVAHTHGM